MFEESIVDFFETADTNKDGVLDYNDFYTVCQPSKGHSKQKELSYYQSSFLVYSSPSPISHSYAPAVNNVPAHVLII